MMTYTLQRRQRIARPVEDVFAFFADAHNLDLITPPWLGFRVLTPAPIPMQSGAMIEYLIRWHGLPVRWLTRIDEWSPNERFVDRQVRGPYRLWRHTHVFNRAGTCTDMDDVVEYAMPLGPLGHLAHALLVRSDLNRIFDYRSQRITQVLS